MNYRQKLGYVLEVDGLHVCGYDGDKIIIQNNKDSIGAVRKYRLTINSKGTFFTYQGKRVYVDKSKK
jgi:hypothetical protein